LLQDALYISDLNVGLEVLTVVVMKSTSFWYMLLSHHWNARQNHDINRCFENVAQFRYLGMTVINQNMIQEEIKRRLNSGNACYHSVQNLSSSRLLSKNIKIRIYQSIILPVVLYGCFWLFEFLETLKIYVAIFIHIMT
jgi:hypothetical protein